MIGKARLLKELSRHICVVYICIRPEDSTGYPPRSEWAYSMLIDSKQNSLEPISLMLKARCLRVIEWKNGLLIASPIQ
ncbi:hypothetical protein VP01_2963g2, partial [Puccinia sorghi]